MFVWIIFSGYARLIVDFIYLLKRVDNIALLYGYGFVSLRRPTIVWGVWVLWGQHAVCNIQQPNNITL